MLLRCSGILNAPLNFFQHPFGFVERRKTPDDASSLVGIPPQENIWLSNRPLAVRIAQHKLTSVLEKEKVVGRKVSKDSHYSVRGE